MDHDERQIILSSKPTVSGGDEDGVGLAREAALPDLPDGLSDPQVVVLRLLYRGRDRIEAARAANVHPGTITRWKRSCPAFQQAFNALDEHRSSSVRDELNMLAEDASLGVRLAISRGNDPRLNLALLKLLGYFKPPLISEPIEHRD